MDDEEHALQERSPEFLGNSDHEYDWFLGKLYDCVSYVIVEFHFWYLISAVLVIPLFLIRGYIDWYLFNERYEGGSYFEVYTPGPENRPFDYDPNFQYEALRIAKFWDLEYENENRQPAEILRELQNTDDSGLNEGSEEI